MNTEQARFNMIEQQIRPWDVLDTGVLALLGQVRREDFLPPAVRNLAFVDAQVRLLPGAGNENACMLEPRVEARLLQELAIQRHEKVLEIGTGCGFMAALLAHRAMHVVSLECRPQLAQMARNNLAASGMLNASVLDVSAEDGAKGLAAEGPFDAIVLSGSVAEVPRSLLEQLKLGGRLAAIVGHEPIMQALLFTRQGEASFAQRSLFDTVAPRLAGFAEPGRFKF